MQLDHDIDETLQRLPEWTPPPGFVTRVSGVARTRVEWERRESRRHAWARSAAYSAAAGLAAAAGAAVWWTLDTYVHIMTVVADLMIEQPLAASWTCAALSLLMAAVTTRRALS